MDCNKCDERGMIRTSPAGAGYWSARSCECGKDARLMKAMFKDVKIGDLLAYGARRIEEKTKLN